MINRRQFITKISLASFVTLAARGAVADNATVSETDPLAISMGYKADGAKVNKVKFPKYDVKSKCDNCVLFKGKIGDASGACALFGGKLVSGTGWCNSWVKRS